MLVAASKPVGIQLGEYTVKVNKCAVLGVTCYISNTLHNKYFCGNEVI